MRAARFHSYGAPEVLVVEDAPEPHVGDGSIRIRVHATSVNPIDVVLRAGHLLQFLPMTLPVIPGRDAVGVVDEVGAGVTEMHVGDVVFGLGGVRDTTAEFAILTAWSVVPERWSMAQAAAAGLASVTAGAALDALGELNGKTLLIEGASGAVGSAVAMFALAAGATVIGTGRESNHPYLLSLGVRPTTYGPTAGRVCGYPRARRCGRSAAFGTVRFPSGLAEYRRGPSPSSTFRGPRDLVSGKSMPATIQPSCGEHPHSGGLGSTHRASTTSFPWTTLSRRTPWPKTAQER